LHGGWIRREKDSLHGKEGRKKGGFLARSVLPREREKRWPTRPLWERNPTTKVEGQGPFLIKEGEKKKGKLIFKTKRGGRRGNTQEREKKESPIARRCPGEEGTTQFLGIGTDMLRKDKAFN